DKRPYRPSLGGMSSAGGSASGIGFESVIACESDAVDVARGASAVLGKRRVSGSEYRGARSDAAGGSVARVELERVARPGRLIEAPGCDGILGGRRPDLGKIGLSTSSSLSSSSSDR